MRRLFCALLGAAALLAVTIAWPAPVNAAGPTPVLGPEGIILTCTGWSIPQITFDTDTDGNGHQTSTLRILSAEMNFQQTFTFPVGTTTSLSGTYSTPPSFNPISAQVDNLPVSLGQCDQIRWAAPGLSASFDPSGGTEPFLIGFVGCQLVPTNLTIIDGEGHTVVAIQDEVIPWPYTGPLVPYYASFPVPVPLGLTQNARYLDQAPVQIVHASAFCGTAAAPLSDTTTYEVPLYDLSPPPPAEPTPPAPPVEAVPSLTG